MTAGNFTKPARSNSKTIYRNDAIVENSIVSFSLPFARYTFQYTEKFRSPDILWSTGAHCTAKYVQSFVYLRRLIFRPLIRTCRFNESIYTRRTIIIVITFRISRNIYDRGRNHSDTANPFLIFAFERPLVLFVFIAARRASHCRRLFSTRSSSTFLRPCILVARIVCPRP